MRAVLDTNIIVSAVLIRRGNEDRILQAWRRRAFELVLSVPILTELAHVMFYDKIKKARWMTDKQISFLFEAFEKESLIVEPKKNITICRDSSDNKFLEAAVTAAAHCIVTGDKDLLDLKSYHHVEIVKPAAFLHLISR